MNDMMRNLMENQQQVAERLKEIKVVADAGSGAVKIEANAKCEVLNITLDPEKIDVTDTEALEDTLLIATNRVMKLALKAQEEETRKSLNSLMPGGLSGLFG